MTSGVHGILNIVNNKLYIGSSVNIYQRWMAHRNKLNKRQHDNSYLQRSWDKHGANAFQFYIIEEVESGRLIEREQCWIDTLRGSDRDLYNVALVVNQPMKGRTHRIETKRIMSKKAIGAGNSMYGKQFSEVHKKRLSDARRGKSVATKALEKILSNNPMHDPVNRDKNSLAQAKTYTMISPNGDEVTFTGLGRFARQNNLTAALLSKVLAGERNHHKSWRRKE